LWAPGERHALRRGMPPVVKKNLGGLQDCHHVTGHKLMTVPSTVVRSRNVPIRVAPATFLHSGLRVSPDHFAFCIPVQPEPAVGRAFASRSQRPPREGGLGEQREAYLPSPRYRRRSAGWSMYHRLHMSQRPVCRTTPTVDTVDTVDTWVQYCAMDVQYSVGTARSKVLKRSL
jgi:hypothetical protein